MTKNKITETPKKTLLGRLKKAVANPVVMAGIAGLSYFAGLKQNSQNNSFDELREAMGGEITHALIEGKDGSKVECFYEGDVYKGAINIGGIETQFAYDQQKRMGVIQTSDGFSMRTNSENEWEEGVLTAEEKSFLKEKLQNFSDQSNQVSGAKTLLSELKKVSR